MGNSTLKYLIVGVGSLFLVACSEEHVDLPHIQYEDINVAMDSIVAKRSYTRLSAKEIIPRITKNLKGTTKLSLPIFIETDTTQTSEYLKALAVSSTYAIWAQELNQPKLKDSAIVRAKYLLEKFDSNGGELELANTTNSDSLDQYLKIYFANDSLENQDAYYEAIAWLENLAITLNFEKNSRNISEYKTLIQTQLLKGEDLLHFLYDYQDYEPISHFSLGMLEVLDCRNYDLNVTQLKELVMDLRAK